jgi:transcription antitermination factor NusG
MMRADPKRLNKAGRAWLDDGGRPIDTSRAEAVALKARAEQRLKGDLLAQASLGDDSQKRWYVLAVTKRDEFSVDKLLSDAGIETWLPLKNKEVCAGPTRKKRTIQVPVFAGIMFVRVVNQASTWPGLYAVDGVFSVFGTAAGPASVSDKEVNKFKGYCESGRYDEKAADGFVPGAHVRVSSGGLQGRKAIVVQHKRTRAERVWVQLFGGIGVTEMPLAILEIDG